MDLCVQTKLHTSAPKLPSPLESAENETDTKKKLTIMFLSKHPLLQGRLLWQLHLMPRPTPTPWHTPPSRCVFQAKTCSYMFSSSFPDRISTPAWLRAETESSMCSILASLASPASLCHSLPGARQLQTRSAILIQMQSALELLRSAD